MPRRMPPAPWCSFLPRQQLDGENDQADDENENADAINAVHIADPLALRPRWILLLQKEIFRELSEYAHAAKIN